jgi:hypothetical protein
MHTVCTSNPKDGDATLLILPEDDDLRDYPPELRRLVPNKDHWWEWETVSIARDYLVGTPWYRVHQHGCTRR